ncbi:thioredoxin family protein [Rhodohalobacter halophilus]|uniref:thioredoxin family protein n=1 Tax=Rhodohalobacter halophilus TaxID=1812810 RepID=UPI00083F51F4|nr:thioredoxin family protein [Rhodohalobacter halophilus]
MKVFEKSLYTLLLTALVWLAAGQKELYSQDTSGQPEPITLEEALKIAPETGKKILIDVFAEWCPYCQRMHADVYTSDEVLEAISEHYIWVRINVESEEMVNYHGNEMTEAQFASALNNESVPTTYFLNSEGSILGSQPGFIEAPMFSSLLNFVGSDEYLNQTFQEYQGR